VSDNILSVDGLDFGAGIVVKQMVLM